MKNTNRRNIIKTVTASIVALTATIFANKAQSSTPQDAINNSEKIKEGRINVKINSKRRNYESVTLLPMCEVDFIDQVDRLAREIAIAEMPSESEDSPKIKARCEQLIASL